MNVKNSLVVVSIALGVVICGCSSDPSKEDPAVKKAFLGGPMPKGFKDQLAGQQAAGQKAAQDAAAKAAAAHTGK